MKKEPITFEQAFEYEVLSMTNFQLWLIERLPFFYLRKDINRVRRKHSDYLLSFKIHQGNNLRFHYPKYKVGAN